MNEKIFAYNSNNFDQRRFFLQKVKKESDQIIKPRSVYFNGGLCSAFGGKPRTFLKVDLPPSTKHLYYRFST